VQQQVLDRVQPERLGRVGGDRRLDRERLAQRLDGRGRRTATPSASSGSELAKAVGATRQCGRSAGRHSAASSHQ
jgi:hypothetical protein